VRWTPEEEKALREGVKRHGMGRWKYIKTDPEFSQCLTNRSNVDLKDKWRNILVAQGDKEKPSVRKERKRQQQQQNADADADADAAEELNGSQGQGGSKHEGVDGQDPASAVVEHAQQNVLAKRRKTGEEAMMKKRGGAAAAGGGKNGTNDAAGAKDDDVKDEDDDDASKEGDTLQLANCQLRNISAKLKSMEGRLTKPPKKAKLSKYKTQMSAADAAEVAGRAVAEALAAAETAKKAMDEAMSLEREATALKKLEERNGAAEASQENSNKTKPPKKR